MMNICTFVLLLNAYVTENLFDNLPSSGIVIPELGPFYFLSVNIRRQARKIYCVELSRIRVSNAESQRSSSVVIIHKLGKIENP